MSSVGSSDGGSRASDNETVRRKYEDFRKKESELVKKQQKEIRRLNESHYGEVERLKEEQQTQMQNLQKGSQDAISARDHKHQQEIEDVRNLHRKTLQGMAEDNQRREETLRNATQMDTKSERQRSQDRFEKLSRDYDSNLKSQEQAFAQGLEDSREAQQSAIGRNRENLTKAHERETASIRDGRDESIRKLQGEYDQYRTTTNKEKREHTVRDLAEKKRTGDNLMRAVRNEREARVDTEQSLREGFQDGLGQMRERYDQALKKNAEMQRMSEDDLKSGITNRVENQVDRLQAQNIDLRDQNVRDGANRRREAQREIANYRDAFQKNVENYKEQRDEVIRSANENTAKDVQKVRDDLETQIVENNRFYQGRMNEQERIQRGAYEQLKGEATARTQQTKDLTDGRVKHVYDVAEEEKSRLIELNNQNHTANQRLKADQMKALREKLEDDKQQAVNRLQDQMRKQELQHAERMGQVVSKYEKQLQGLKDQMLRERKLGEEGMKRMTEELARVHKMEVEQVENKNREKLRQLNTQHGEELRGLNRRHEDKLDQVIGEMKKT